MKVDIVVLRRGCYQSSKVMAEVDMDAVMDNDFRGREGQELLLFQVSSERAEELLLETLGIKGECPLIRTHDGAIIEKAKNVIMHLRRNGSVREI